ncbi:MAG: thioredoxin family protein [Desulfobacterales bacterium]|nr:thioredoxin family protein [Desulfobacterales bacterium]
MIDPSAREQIQNWQVPEGISITLPVSKHPEQQTFDTFAGEWEALNPGISWKKDPEDLAEIPGFRLRENITYSALPLERELIPFLSGLTSIAAPSVSEDVQTMLDRLELPCELTLYIALQCPHCPGMVNTLIPLAAACDKIRLHIIDGSLFREQAEADRVMAAPCLILDNDFRWTGSVPETEILSMVLNRDPSALGTGTLKNILEEGNADWITDRMMASNQIFEGFIGLLLHETWSVRLGAMVVVESLAERAPDLGLTLVPALIDVFEDQEIPVQGDILYALGEIGSLETMAWIRERKDGFTHADLSDAAEDAIEAIESRGSD